MNVLLALVDLQGDYLRSPGLEPAAGHVIHHAAILLHQFRTSGRPVAHVWTTTSRAPDNRMPHWKNADDRRCLSGAEGHAPPDILAPIAGEDVFHKAFFSAFAAPGFAQRLRDRAIDTLIVAGVHTHACVRQTAIDAYQAGLRVLIAEDAIASDDPVHAAITSRYLDARCIRFASHAELDAALSGDKSMTALESHASIDHAVNAACGGAVACQRLAADVRRELLDRLASRLNSEVACMAMLMAEEIGKPVHFGRMELLRTVDMLKAVVRRHQRAETESDAATPDALTRRRPLGVCAVITPWNNPAYIPLGKIGPAILHGNAVVWKPAPQARETSRAIMRLMREAGWPADVVTLLEGGRRESLRLMADRHINGVTLTGSSLAGYAAQEACARRRIPLQAELGGNNAAIVWQDADLSLAARLIAAGAFEQAGQRCTANRRVIVLESQLDPLLELLTKEAAALPWGDPRSDLTRIGPLVDFAQQERVAATVRRAGKTRRIVLPHGAANSDGANVRVAWYPPTIICCDDPQHELVQEETFGPILVMQSARDFDQAMRLCNGVRQGLAAAIFTGDRAVAAHFLNEARAGILKVNQSTADAAIDVPFGGWKSSGIGPPEHGEFDREFFTRPQTVYADPLLRPQ